MAIIRLIRLPEVKSMTGLGRASIYRYIAEGRFPQQVHVGSRAAAWVEGEVAEWLEGRVRAARAPADGDLAERAPKAAPRPMPRVTAPQPEPAPAKPVAGFDHSSFGGGEPHSFHGPAPEPGAGTAVSDFDPYQEFR